MTEIIGQVGAIDIGAVANGALNLTGLGLVAFVLRQVFVTELPAQRRDANTEREKWFAALQLMQDRFSAAIERMHEFQRAEREADRKARHEFASSISGPLMNMSNEIREAVEEFRKGGVR